MLRINYCKKNRYMKKLIKYFTLLLVIIPLSQPGYAQLTEEQRKERCQNNKNHLIELEKQLAIVNAELSKTPERKEIEEERDHMVFVKKIKNDPDKYYELSSSDLAAFNRILSKYNFNFGGCHENDSYTENEQIKYCLNNLYNIIARKIERDKALLPQRPGLLKQKTDINKQIDIYHNNLVALGCDVKTAEKNTDIDLNSVTGTWDWYWAESGKTLERHGTVTFYDNGKMSWDGGSDGTWTQTGNTVSLTWTKGDKDDMTLEAGGTILSGDNTAKKLKVQGKRGIK